MNFKEIHKIRLTGEPVTVLQKAVVTLVKRLNTLIANQVQIMKWIKGHDCGHCSYCKELKNE